MGLHSDNYAISILEKEVIILESVVKSWPGNDYPEAKKDREIKLKDLKKAINKLSEIASKLF